MRACGAAAAATTSASLYHA
ncbi:hypothetical protein C3F00_023685 [Pseudomonas sp. MWU13-2860]|nr:hypothetical protein C3F00_023685 [Pseudomonas sp. MWU13-2860]